MNNLNDLLNTVSNLIYREDVDIVVKKYTENNTFNGEEFYQSERVNIIFEKKEEDGADEDCEDEAEVILKLSFEINPYHSFLSAKNAANEIIYSNSEKFYVMKFKILFEDIMSKKFDKNKKE